jgi:nucleotide-binding universal stress UspA family protein
MEAESRKQAETGLARLKSKADKAKVKAVTQSFKGPAANQILKSAKGQRAELIVVGAHGRTGLSKLLLGSIASRVIPMADRPVLTVPGR